MHIGQTLRSTLALVATAAGFGASFYMLRRVIGPASPWLGLLPMFYFLGLAKIAQPLFTFRVPARLRAVRAWETSGPASGRLAVHAFGGVLRNTPLRRLNSSVYLPPGRRRDLRALHRQVESAEAIHFWAMVLFTPYIAFVGLQRHVAVAALFVLVQVIINVYPILHLRTLRGRLDALTAKPRARRPTRPSPSPVKR